MARPTKYNDDFPLLAEGFAREGFNDEEIAAKLGIVLSTYYDFQNKYSEFSKAIKRGKAPVDTIVENALLKRATGYDVDEKRVVMKNIKIGKDKDGFDVYKPIKVEETIITKHVPPDVGAQAFWLKNRKPAQWRDKHDYVVEDKTNPEKKYCIKIKFEDD